MEPRKHVRKAIRPLDRLPMREWLMCLLEQGETRGLNWVDRENGVFSVNWQHGKLHDWDARDCDVFLAWAKHTGKYMEGDAPNPKRWKVNFRTAVHSLKDIVLLKVTGKRKNKTRVYKMLKGETRPRRVSFGGKKPIVLHQCVNCDMIFQSYGELVNHNKIHIKEEPVDENDPSLTVSCAEGVDPKLLPTVVKEQLEMLDPKELQMASGTCQTAVTHSQSESLTNLTSDAKERVHLPPVSNSIVGSWNTSPSKTGFTVQVAKSVENSERQIAMSSIRESAETPNVYFKRVKLFFVYMCEFCHKKFESKSDRDLHYRDHIKVEVTVRNDTINTQEESVDSNVCEFCGKQFNHDFELSAHYHDHIKLEVSLKYLNKNT